MKSFMPDDFEPAPEDQLPASVALTPEQESKLASSGHSIRWVESTSQPGKYRPVWHREPGRHS